MTEAENIVLEHLRHIRGVVDAIREDVREMLRPVGAIESSYTAMSSRMDRMDGRIERIERRLQLTEV